MQHSLYWKCSLQKSEKILYRTKNTKKKKGGGEREEEKEEEEGEEEEGGENYTWSRRETLQKNLSGPLILSVHIHTCT